MKAVVTDNGLSHHGQPKAQEEEVIVTEERVSIPLYNKALSKIATGVCNAAGSIYWSMDATFNTNIHNLALLMIGVAASVVLSETTITLPNFA